LSLKAPTPTGGGNGGGGVALFCPSEPLTYHSNQKSVVVRTSPWHTPLLSSLATRGHATAPATRCCLLFTALGGWLLVCPLHPRQCYTALAAFTRGSILAPFACLLPASYPFLLTYQRNPVFLSFSLQPGTHLNACDCTTICVYIKKNGITKQGSTPSTAVLKLQQDSRQTEDILR